jgi:diguanylate cyclase
MDANPNTQKRFARSVLGWLRGQDDETRASPPPVGASEDPPQLSRAVQLALIDDFLDAHDLAVSPQTLAAAFAVTSGSSPALARRIEDRVAEGERVSGPWLVHASGERSDPGALEEDVASPFEPLLEQLRAMLDSFAVATKSVRSATGEYGSALEQQAASIAQIDGQNGVNLDELAGLVRSMIARTQKAEEDMRRSDQESAGLRASLAKAQHDAKVDALTGLPNRRAFEAHYAEIYRETREAVEPLSVAFCDIDHFKRINDRHGHETGDRMLKTVASSLSAISGENCHVARHGGEEFVMLFRGNSPEEALERLDALREALAARNFVNRHNDQPIGRVTFSAGIADAFAYPDPREALRAADRALYKAKESGRNRIELADE